MAVNVSVNVAKSRTWVGVGSSGESGGSPSVGKGVIDGGKGVGVLDGVTGLPTAVER